MVTQRKSFEEITFERVLRAVGAILGIQPEEINASARLCSYYKATRSHLEDIVSYVQEDYQSHIKITFADVMRRVCQDQNRITARTFYLCVYFKLKAVEGKRRGHRRETIRREVDEVEE